MFVQSSMKKIVWADDFTANCKQLSPIDFCKIRLTQDFTIVIGSLHSALILSTSERTCCQTNKLNGLTLVPETANC